MSPLLIGAIVLVVAAFAIWQAPMLIKWRDQPIDINEARVRRLIQLIDLIKELESVGAKSAAGKLKTAASLLIDETF